MGDSDFKQAFDLAMGSSTSGEAARRHSTALRSWPDEIAVLLLQVEKVAQGAGANGL